jgi:oligopeptide transport system substrate-binding protein
MKLKEPGTILKYLILMAIFISIAACSGKGTPTETLPATTPLPIPSTPTLTFSPAMTPAPTARPLFEGNMEEGLYSNDNLGVSMQYPTEWELEQESSSEGDQLFLSTSDFSLMVFLVSAIDYEESPLEDTFDEIITTLPESFDLETVTWSPEKVAFDLGEATSGLRSVGEGLETNSADLYRLEVIFGQRGTRYALLIVFGLTEAYDANSQELAMVRESLTMYSPHPYGVDRDNALFLASGQPNTFDPTKWLGSAGGIVGDIFSGLVQLDNNLQTIPDLAERWEVSPDGRVYTFYLRQGVTFHDGKPFTALDVKYSWEHAIDPETESDTAETYLGDIMGVSEVIAGDASEISGVRIIDDYTIEVTLDKPKVYFLSKLAYPTSWIVDQETIDQIDKQPNGTGPFRLVKYDENEIIILARNHNYHRNFVALEYIVYLVFPGPTIRLYEAGDIDIVYIDEDLLERAKDPEDPLYGNVFPSTGLCTSYLGFDVTKPPFDDFLVRKAFALSIDKERYNDVISEGRGVIAYGLYPPGLPGYQPREETFGYDPEAALEALRDSSYRGAEGLPEIVFTTGGAGTDISPSVGLLIDMWKEALGVEVEVEQLGSQTFIEQLNQGNSAANKITPDTAILK